MAEPEKLQLLVVEDDEDDYFLIRHLLQDSLHDAVIERAATVDDALDRTAHTPFDLFLLDYRLGDQDGLELLRQLPRRDASAPDPGEPDVGLAGRPSAPVIFLTGQGDEEVAVQAMKAGATDYLPKSKLNQPSLNLAVRYAINLRHQEEAVRAARRALHSSERRFRALVENSTDLVRLLDLQAVILYVSQSLRRILGFAPHDLLDTCTFDYLHPEDVSELKQIFSLALQSPGLPLRSEYRVRHQDGGWRVLEGTLINHLHDPAVGAVVVNEHDITERKQMEEALRISECEYRTLFENANDAIMIFEPETEIILEANPQACSIYGFPHDELVGMSLKQISQDADRGRQAVALVLQDGRLDGFETVHFRKDGRPLSILANASLIHYRGRQAILSLSRDLSERKLAEREMRKLHSAVEQSADVVIITDPDGAIEYVNPAFQSLTGYSRQEVLGQTPRLLKSGRHHPAFYQQLWDTIRHGQVFRDVLINRKKNGELYYAEKTITPVLDERGQIIHFISNDRDITQRILSQRQRLRAEEELRASEHKYRMLVETANEGIWTLDAEDRITFGNAKIAALLGCEPAHMLARSVYDFAADPAPLRPALQRLRAGLPQQADAVLRRRDGSDLYVILNANPIYDRDGAYAGALVMMADSTERRALEEQLRHAQKMDAVGQLAGGVAHDFNNLLMVISSYAELLADSLSHDPKALRSLEQIRGAARRAAGLTRQLLAFSRKQVLAPRLLDLNQALADFGRMLPRVIGEDVAVVLRPGEQLWKVKADPVQIEQVLMNLALNARDAMPQGGRLTLETANVALDDAYAARHAGVAPGQYVMTAVTDTGNGIPPDILPRIFEPFFTTKEQGKGTGLGLPTVYGIVKQSGGFVFVYSEVGHGTSFKVYLPRAEESLAANRSSSAGSANACPEPSRGDQQPTTNDGTETLLLVEDEEAVREPAAVFLASHGYTVLQAKDGNDALQVLQHYGGKVEMLVTDVIMPGMSGCELAARIAQARPGIRVLYISGYTEATVARHGLAGPLAGDPAQGFLQKPFSLSGLARKVREVLETPPP